MIKDDLRGMAKAFRYFRNPDNEPNLVEFASQVAESVLNNVLSRQGPITFRPMGSSDACRAMVVGVHEIEALKRELRGEKEEGG